MQGTIRSFIEEKSFGFIDGEDGKSYFVHATSFKDPSQIAKLCDGATVSFDATPTVKGYKAKFCSLVDPNVSVSYREPDDFVTSKTNQVRDWEVVDLSNWEVHSSLDQSIDDALACAKQNAIQIGANALLNLTYYKTRGSQGNYIYSIHHYCGRAATVAARHARGTTEKSKFVGLDRRAAELKDQLDAKHLVMKRKAKFGWAVGIVAAMLTAASSGIFAVVVLVVTYFFTRVQDPGWWLVAGPGVARPKS